MDNKVWFSGQFLVDKTIKQNLNKNKPTWQTAALMRASADGGVDEALVAASSMIDSAGGVNEDSFGRLRQRWYLDSVGGVEDDSVALKMIALMRPVS